MKKSLIVLALVVAGVTGATSPAWAWRCFARGTTGATGFSYGYYYLSSARQRALIECAIRTPRWARCYIVRCRPG
ncbi:MAG: hypothetical protein KGQ37_12525 [Hyphomicrobiales bacterium]|nr:hypothetical protein [Hyphomicrobiales bacterium]